MPPVRSYRRHGRHPETTETGTDVAVPEEKVMKKDIRVDARGHVNLAGLRKEEDASWYFGHRDPDGTIHLVPAMLVPAKLEKAPEEGLDVLREKLGNFEVIRTELNEREFT